MALKQGKSRWKKEACFVEKSAPFFLFSDKEATKAGSIGKNGGKTRYAHLEFSTGCGEFWVFFYKRCFQKAFCDETGCANTVEDLFLSVKRIPNLLLRLYAFSF